MDVSQQNTTAVRRSTRSTRFKRPASPEIKQEPSPKRQKSTPNQTVKTEPVDTEVLTTSIAIKNENSPQKTVLLKKKVKSETSSNPFPTFSRPTPQECHDIHDVLTELHGKRERPKDVIAPENRAGCGDSPSVLDALVRTILSQNTSNKNSTRAKLSMDQAYGSSRNWDLIVDRGQAFLEQSIRCGGLSVTKSKVIMNLLNTVHDKYGKYSLDHMFDAEDQDAMDELVSFPGVGPKTASCILLFCLQRPSFAVDTHVYRLTGMLGWRPAKATREQTQTHLDRRVPDGLKYPLHVLLIAHGRDCSACKAGGSGTCKLRKAIKR